MLRKAVRRRKVNQRAMKLRAAAERVEKSIHETLAYSAYPPQHGLKIKTNNPMERLLKEARRRTKVVGAFPDGNNEMDQEAVFSVA